MMIDPKRRYFRLTPKAVAVFEEYEEEWNQARLEHRATAREILLALGVPEEETDIPEWEDSGRVVFPASLRKYIPKLLKKPSARGYCEFKRNSKKGREINARLRFPKVESLAKRLPTLGCNWFWIIPGYWVWANCGRYGDGVYLINVMRIPDADGRIYEPDPELVEELTLSEWAAIVERVEGGGS